MFALKKLSLHFVIPSPSIYINYIYIARLFKPTISQKFHSLRTNHTTCTQFTLRDTFQTIDIDGHTRTSTVWLRHSKSNNSKARQSKSSIASNNRRLKSPIGEESFPCTLPGNSRSTTRSSIAVLRPAKSS